MCNTATDPATGDGSDTVCVITCYIDIYSGDTTCDTNEIIFVIDPVDTIITSPVDPGDSVTTCTGDSLVTGGIVSTMDCAGNTSGSGNDGSYNIDSLGCVTFTATDPATGDGSDTVCVITCYIDIYSGDTTCDTNEIIFVIDPVDTIITSPVDPGDSVMTCTGDSLVTGGIVSTTDCAGNTSGSGNDGSYNIDSLGCVTFTATDPATGDGSDTVCVITCYIDIYSGDTTCDTNEIIFVIDPVDTIITSPVDPGIALRPVRVIA